MEDEEISKELARVFRKRGIETNTGASGEGGEDGEQRSRVSYTDANRNAQTKEAEKVLVAVGRGPLTNGIGLGKRRSSLNAGP